MNVHRLTLSVERLTVAGCDDDDDDDDDVDICLTCVLSCTVD